MGLEMLLRNTPERLRFLLIGLAFLSGTACAAPWDSLFQNDRPCQVRTGVTFRNIDADFTLNPISPAIAASLLSFDPGRGNVGFYTGGSEPVVYDDGQVGLDVPSGMSPTGQANYIVNSRDQIASTNRIVLGDPVYRATFTSSEFDVVGALSTDPTRISDDDIDAGYFIEFVKPIGERTNFLIGYSYVDSELHADQGVLGYDTTYFYSYDILSLMNPDGQSYPLNSQIAAGAGLVTYDNNLLTTFPGTDVDVDDPLVDPSFAMQRELVPFAVCVADLDVALHEIPIGLEWEKHYGDTVISCNGGLTLNIIDYELTSTLRGISGMPVYIAKDAGNEFRVGAFVGINVTHSLNDDGSVFLTAHASYRWVDSFTASAGHASVEVDPSSFEGGVGIGFVLQ